MSANRLQVIAIMNRVDRLVAQILYLQSHPLCTADELAGHFGLSLRTIYRDLAALGEAGVPVVAQAGVGYSLARGYHLPPVSFTSEEASALITGSLLAERLADASVQRSTRTALMKVRAVRPRVGLVLTLATVDWERLTFWLLSFGNDVEVISPASLRKRIMKVATSIAAHHQKNPKGS